MGFIKQVLGSFIGALLAIAIFWSFDFLRDTQENKVLLSQGTKSCPQSTRYLSTLNGKKVCELKGVYTHDLKLTADFYWALNGEVVMGGDNIDSMTLEIEPGTTVYGSEGPDYLLISRGSKIEAKGTKLLPIVFTSAQDVVGRADKDSRGQWGGLVIAGNASTNDGFEEVFEFSKTGRKFGGSNDKDNSGTLRYVLVKYAGYEVALDKELNGISFGGVGSGTTVDYVEVYNNADDGIELWGGTVNLRHIVLVGNGDDAFDMDHGYRGNVQYLYIKQTDVISYDPRGIEADNHKSSFEALPYTSATIANFDIVGSNLGETGVMLRRGASVHMLNGTVSGFGRYCLSMRNKATLDHKASFNGVFFGNCGKGTFGAKYHLDAKAVEKYLLDDNVNNSNNEMPDAIDVKAHTGNAFFDKAEFIGSYQKDRDWRELWSIGI